MRLLPNAIEELKVENDISFMGLNLPLSEHFEEAIPSISRMTRSMKSSP
jgi:hypothetical protein